MKYKTGAMLAKFVGPDGTFVMQRQVKVRHFRNRIGKEITPKGGHSVLFDLDYGAIITTNCHPNDLFSKKVGLRVCIDRWVEMMKNDGYVVDKINGKPKVTSVVTFLDEIVIHLGVAT